MFGGPFFEGRDKILLLGEALKFGVSFQKIDLNLLKNMKYLEIIWEKMQNFHDNFAKMGSNGGWLAEPA